jgi:7-carboxy-7-deazaguanine synthase
LNNFCDIKFNISEIFYSIQGEGTRAGLPCVFIRMQGCKLRCVWCDTKYALQLGKNEIIMSAQEIIDKVEAYESDFIEFTGGEPLEQAKIVSLIEYFIQKGKTVAIETAGYLSLEGLPEKLTKIVDFKAPGSKMDKYNNLENLKYLNHHDEVKFVLTDIDDYNWAKEFIETNNLYANVDNILFSPVFDKLSYQDLAEWILRDRLKVRMQLQMHKYIWEPNKRGV